MYISFNLNDERNLIYRPVIDLLLKYPANKFIAEDYGENYYRIDGTLFYKWRFVSSKNYRVIKYPSR